MCYQIRLPFHILLKWKIIRLKRKTLLLRYTSVQTNLCSSSELRSKLLNNTPSYVFSNALSAALAISKYALAIPSLTVNLAYKIKGLLLSVITFPPYSSLKILLYNNLCSLNKTTLPTRWHST